MKRILLAAAMLIALTGCEERTLTETQMAKRERAEAVQAYVHRGANSYEVCIGGAKRLYIESGNSSQFVTIYRSDTRVVTCEEAEQ